MADVRQAAIHFEAVKVSMNQNKDGMALRLNIHPNDCPHELIADWVGTRYMVAMVRLTDDDQPDTREDMKAIERMISSAGMLCRSEEFYAFLLESGMCEYTTDADEMEQESIKAVRGVCEIGSRSEFRSNADARRRFDQLRDEFKDWKERRL